VDFESIAFKKSEVILKNTNELEKHIFGIILGSRNGPQSRFSPATHVKVYTLMNGFWF
jgi:hypothetical protein